ncbi:2-oxoisovalerate dehydrogenase subunit beta [Lacunisphaera limnophila]|uniref:3-methyl-2-oxobutanoate dehydrogenase (2-methylpropanoyl-transferring) n=1 Tax=Lacunisphaera limnophila TaxID=1838286 RepID=A0A1D8AUE8_9BACT|nr:thiamine pyrophosphate-dependent enzyme [Lacunisphaera limnophila]AOS44524.1 2-oxoisovalerate dehydrogenase subunit beta [Lacunisphaera limnophila]
MAQVATLNKEQKRHLLVTMLESRLGDLREESLNRQGKGHFHVSGRGHEGLAAVGVQLRQGDFVVPYYRDRGMCMGRGMTTRHLALEYFAKRDSASRGRMMPSHYCSRELNIVSVPTPTGSQLVPACGIAWGLQLDQKDGVVVTSIGDAATRQGDFYEALSIALERKLPVLLIVEDNAYGISTPTHHTNPLVLQAVNPAQWQVVDGADPLAVHAATQEALARIRGGGGPVFLWVKVERLSSHTSSDDHTLYRSKEAIAALEQRDPIRALKARMLQDGELTEKEFEKIEADLKEKVRLDYAAAEKAENPRADELLIESVGPLPEVTAELFKPGKYRMGDLINRTLRAGLDADPARMIFGEDVEDPKGGVFRLTQKLSTDFPAQVFNSPLAESTIIGLAGGLALYGRRPVFEIQFIDFIYPGFNQLVSNLANLRWRTNGEWKVPAVFYAPYGAYLPGGSLWHSQANESVFAHFPGINIIIPSTPEDAAGLLWTAMHAEDITLFLLPKHMLWAERETAVPVAAIPFGVARHCTEGSALTLVAWGNTVEKAHEALALLGEPGAVELLDLRSVVPWDKAAVEESVRKTGRLVIVQEDTENCSVGQMIISHLLAQPGIWAALKAPPVLVSKGNVMIGYNPIYEYAALPDGPRIVEALRRTLAIDVARGEELAGLAAAAPLAVEPTGHAAAPAADPHAHAPQSTVVAGTNDIIVRVPIMGEGLRSARVVALNKKPGDPVKHDEVLCELETDKAVYPVEASFAGTFKAWSIKLEETVLIGQAIAQVTGDAASVAGLAIEAPVTKAAAAPSAPTTRGAAAAAPVAPAPASPLMQGQVRPPALSPAITKRLDTVVPANLLMDCRWEPIRLAREAAKAKHGKAAASPSSMMAWCVTRTMELHAGFRRVVNKDGVIHELGDFDLGVAVALDGDRLGTAAITAANKLAWADFVTAYNRAVEETRGGKLVEVQAPLNISSLGAFGVENATPIVVPPAMSTLFIGSAHEKMVKDGGIVYPMEVVTLSLTFDHRVVNGAGAAAFMMELKRQFETFALPA